MTAHKGIFELTSTKMISWLFGVVIFLATILISVSAISNYSLCLTPDGFENFIQLYNVPIKLAAAYGAILGLISLNHRSIQTKEQLDRTSTQIELIQAQNLFTNYYKHREEFVKYSDKIAGALECKPIDTAAFVHNNLFPNAKDGDYAPYDIANTDLFDRLAKIIKECQTCIDEGKFNIVNDSLFQLSLSRSFNDLEILTGTRRSKNWKFNDTISSFNFENSVHSMASIFFLLLSDYWVMTRFEKDIQTNETREVVWALGDFKDNFECNDDSDVSTQIKPYLENITRAISRLKT
ncbi:hypothetical protein ACE1OE_01820 [Vibrio sp. E150_011]